MTMTVHVVRNFRYQGGLKNPGDADFAASDSDGLQLLAAGLVTWVNPAYAKPDVDGEIVTITAAQRDSPTAAMLADTEATYRLDVAPFGRYQSNGTALVPLGSGAAGAVAITGANTLTQAAHANRHLTWTGSSTAAQALPSTQTSGDIIELTNGGTAFVTFTNVTTPPGFKASCGPSETFQAVSNGTTWTSCTPRANTTIQALTDGATISTDLDLALQASVTLAGNRSLAGPTNAQDGGVYTWWIKQDGTGSRTLTLPTRFKKAAADSLTLSTGAGKLDVLTATYNAALDTFFTTLKVDVGIYVAPTMSFCGKAAQDIGSAVHTASIDIGAAAADRVIVVGATLASGALTITSVVVNGVTLTQNALVDGGGVSDYQAIVYSGVVASGSGAQNVVITWSGAAWSSMAVWRLTGLSSTAAKDTATGNGSANPSATITVDEDDFMFAFGKGNAPAPAYDLSTEVPDTNHGADTIYGVTVGASWTIDTPNAAFVVRSTTLNSTFAVASFA